MSIVGESSGLAARRRGATNSDQPFPQQAVKALDRIEPGALGRVTKVSMRSGCCIQLAV